MDNVLLFPGTTDLDYTVDEDEGVGPTIPIDQLIEGIKEQDFSSLIVIGRTEEGLYFASTSGEPQTILWDLKRAEHILMQSYFSEEN